MDIQADFNLIGEDLEKLLILRYAPIAFKLLGSEDEIPAGAYRPKRDRGEHLAMCQATALVRRQRKSIAMFKDDHWCIWPIIGFGLAEFREGTEYYENATSKNFVQDPDKARAFFKNHYPRLEVGSCTGFVMAPLASANFEPDLVIIYAKPAQLRSMLMAVKFKSGRLLECGFDAVDSCVHSTIPALKLKDYRITFPDPGEYERGLADEDEIIFTVPREKLTELMEGLTALSKSGFGYRQLYMEMTKDFPRPQFYDDLFKMWGLDQGEIWVR